MELMLTEELNSKLRRAKKHAETEKRRYWKVRNEVISYLGGRCPCCGETNSSKLEIHHDPPRLTGGYKGCNGAAIIREWKDIMAGKVRAKLCCHEYHIKVEHNGNTNELKKIKS